MAFLARIRVYASGFHRSISPQPVESCTKQANESMYSSQSDDDQISPSGYFFDQFRTGDGRIIDFLTAVANLDFGATSLAYNELMSVQSEILGSSFSDQLQPILPKEFSFLDSQATSQFHFSPGVTDQPASAARAYKASIDAMEKVTVTEGLKGAGAEAKEMPCKHWFHLPCIEKWLGKCTYCPPFSFAVPVAVLVMLIMKTCSKT